MKINVSVGLKYAGILKKQAKENPGYKHEKGNTITLVTRKYNQATPKMRNK